MLAIADKSGTVVHCYGFFVFSLSDERSRVQAGDMPIPKSKTTIEQPQLLLLLLQCSVRRRFCKQRSLLLLDVVVADAAEISLIFRVFRCCFENDLKCFGRRQPAPDVYVIQYRAYCCHLHLNSSHLSTVSCVGLCIVCIHCMAQLSPLSSNKKGYAHISLFACTTSP